MVIDQSIDMYIVSVLSYMYSTSMIFCNDNEDTLLLMENLLGTLAYVGLQPCHNPKEAKQIATVTVVRNKCLSVLYLHHLYVLLSVYNSVHLTEWESGLYNLGIRENGSFLTQLMNCFFFYIALCVHVAAKINK